MISSELPELLGMSDRILVMHRGRIQAEIAARRRDRGARAERGAGTGLVSRSRSGARAQFGTLDRPRWCSCAVLWILTPHFLTVSNLLNVAEQTSINADRRRRHDVRDPLRRHRSLGRLDRRAGGRRARHGAAERAAAAGRAGAGAAPSAPAAGLVNGALISWGGLPPFIVTLGTMSIARGAALLFTEGRPVSGFDASFRALATGRVGFVPAPVIAMALVYAGRAFRADAHDVRPLRLRDRRQRGGDAAVGRRGPLSQDDDLRRVGADERHRGGHADGAAQLGAADRRHRCTSSTRSPRR